MTLRESESLIVPTADSGGTGAFVATAPSGETDEALMARIAGGDEKAFRIFAARHVPKCLAVAQRIVGNACDAEEIVQDAMLRVWRYAPSWHRTNARVTTWLYRIVANLSVDRARKRRPPSVPLDNAAEPADPAPGADAILEVRQLEAFIVAAIKSLPTRQRAALTLCYFEAMDCAQAAHVMGVSISAMESLLVRGRRTLKAQLHLRGFAEFREVNPLASPRPRSSGAALLDSHREEAMIVLAAAALAGG
ncbi:MAG: RNA polymerase sigma factor [Alphaproteobacteria bacterium]